ncbi:hypothetical protein [Limisalsivibrio acetivorans]|uniref:hypothetical protein n=1 Tax=Limisalsivibrio acetivorans TaxID=1304888 RepID=UPI0003B4F0D5|nr:hypothetical protein [Limisalsivibrio acetivorans]
MPIAKKKIDINESAVMRKREPKGKVVFKGSGYGSRDTEEDKLRRDEVRERILGKLKLSKG